MRSVIEHLEGRSRRFLLILGFGLIVILGFIDYLTGYETSFAVFYVLPISIVAYLTGKQIGVVASVICAVVGFTANYLAGETLQPLIYFWNALVRLGFFLIVALLLSALRSAYERERELARTDYLTGAVNVRSFYELAQVEMLRSRRYNHPFTVAYLDADNFKTVNDSFGHNIGDVLLQAISRVIKDQLRETDVIARLGGDEFVILLPEAGYEAAEVAISKVRQSLLDETQKRGLPVTFSIGMLTCVDLSSTIEEIVRLADNLMYEVKKDGKNKIKHEVMLVKIASEVMPE